MRHQTQLLLALIVTLFGSSLYADGIHWRRSFLDALKESERTQQHMFVQITADWCNYCKKMDAGTLSDPEIVKLINSSFIPVKVNADEQKTLTSRIKVQYVPSSVVISADRKILAKLAGYQSIAKLSEQLPRFAKPLARRAPQIASSRSVTQKPRPVTQRPQPVTQRPQPVTQRPQPVTQRPQPVSKPELFSSQPTTASKPLTIVPRSAPKSPFQLEPEVQNDVAAAGVQPQLPAEVQAPPAAIAPKPSALPVVSPKPVAPIEPPAPTALPIVVQKPVAPIEPPAQAPSAAPFPVVVQKPAARIEPPKPTLVPAVAKTPSAQPIATPSPTVTQESPALKAEVRQTVGEEKPKLERPEYSFNRVCLCSLLDEQTMVMGSNEHSHEYKGAKLCFASEEHLSRFIKNPQRYWPAWGGVCAHSLRFEGKLMEGSPRFGAVFQDRLWFFSTQEHKNEFSINPRGYLPPQSR